MKSPNPNIINAKNRNWRKRILVTLAILILLPLTLFTIGWFNRDRIIEVIHDRYTENSEGTLTIGTVNTSFIGGFPNVEFVLKDINYTSKDTITDQYAALQIAKTKLVIGAGNLLRGDFVFKKIEITKAAYVSRVVSSRSVVYHQQLKLQQQKNRKKGFQFPDWLANSRSILVLNDVKFRSTDSILKKHFDLYIHKFQTTYKKIGFNIEGETTLDLTVNSLGFNTKKGHYFNGAKVSGHPKYIINLNDDYIDIPSFPLQIEQQTFQISAQFDLSNIAKYAFQLENATTNLEAIKRLLPENITTKLEPYQIHVPFNSNLEIAGKFQYGNQPEINAYFSTVNNEIDISDRFHLNHVTFKGSLTNNIYDTDSLRIAKKSPSDFKLSFEHLTADLEGISVDIRDSYFKSTPENLNFFDANVRLKGPNEALADIIRTHNFDFIGGTFHFDAHIYGNIPSPYQFFNNSTGEFRLKGTRVVLRKNGLQLPVQSLVVSLQNENASLQELIVNVSNGEVLTLEGTLTNLSGLLAPKPLFPTTSQISLTSNHLNINEMIALMKKFIKKPNSLVDDRKNLQETLEAVYTQFHPQFDLNIGSLTYNDVVINNVDSRMALLTPNTIVIDNFDFNYEQARTNLNGTVKIYGAGSRLKDAIFIDAEAQSHGPISVFKELFNIQLFSINSGTYQFSGAVEGTIREFHELLNVAKGDLTLSNTRLFYAPTASEIAIDSLALRVVNSNILLSHFDLQIDKLYPVNLSGSINQFPNFLLDRSTGSGSIDLNIAASFFDGDALLTTLNELDRHPDSTRKKNKKALHRVFSDINRFNPEINVNIDSLKFKNLITEHLEAQLYFENDSILRLDHLHLNYKDSFARVYGEVNAHDSAAELQRNNPFNLDFHVNVKGKSEDLNAYLKSKNFLFESGDYEFYGNYRAQAKDLTLINANGFGDLKLRATLVEYQAADLQIPVDSLHLEINNDVATLKTLDIQLPGKSKVYFSGSIDHFSEFINNSDGSSHHSSKFSIKAPYLDIMNVQQFLYESSIGNGDKKPFDLVQWKQAMRNINSSFYPQLAIHIDTLKHDRLSVTNFGSQLSFGQQKRFRIDDLGLNFHEGSVQMNVSVGIARGTTTPIAIEMDVDEINIYELLSRVDYFDNQDLKETDSIQGKLSFQMKAQGVVNAEGQLNPGSINGTLQIKIDELLLYNYKPIMENVPLLSSKRFEKLRFRPIFQRFEIKQGEVVIPQTEIQSSAIQLFVEGRLKLNDYINIWLSVPWKNLKSNDGLTLPPKTTYEDAGSKFFLQFLQNKNSKKARKQKLRIKFKIGNGKLKKLRRKEF